ncbi:MAG TPA: NnrS family protein [Burkholderiales bacterium]|nr:NnrS family protein [Burkholderiales bacterium]
MSIAIEERARQLRQPTVFSYAFRSLFLVAGLWAIVGIVIWLAIFLGYLILPTRFNPLAWHIHEMQFGFVMAAVGGFLLTAIPNWTNRLPFRGLPLALLTGLWLLGRVACLISANLPAWLAIIADLSFPIVLLAVATRQIIAARNWRSLLMTGPVAVFVIADLLMHFESLGFAVPTGLGWRLGLAAPILLITVIGGRIIPSFTRNWLSKRDSARLPSPHSAVDRAAVGLLHGGLIIWALLPDLHFIGTILLVAALLNAWRLSRWAGGATLAEPLLFILHVGYGWVVVGTALLGLSLLVTVVPVASAIHALTVGAMGTMILAVMPRVTLGHTGRDLTANRATVAIYVLINAAAIMRVAASWSTNATLILVVLSGICWITAFGLFEIVYGPMLVARRLGQTT